MKLAFKTIGIVFVGVFCLGNAEFVCANDIAASNGLQISPTKFFWTLSDGASKIEKINIKNYSNTEQKVSVEVENFYIGEDGSEPKFYTSSDERELKKSNNVINWIIPPDDFVLAPGESKWVEFQINVPIGQPTSGYYGGILFRTDGLDSDTKAQVNINYRVGALVIMAVQGDEQMKKTVEFVNFSHAKQNLLNPDFILDANIINTGNIHFPMFGEINISKFGKNVKNIALTPQVIYPEINRQYIEEVSFEWWDFGVFVADLHMWSEDEKIQLHESVTFWVIPWKIITGILFVICSVFAIIGIKKRFKIVKN